MQPWWVTILVPIVTAGVGFVTGAYANHRFALSRSRDDRGRQHERESLRACDEQLQKLRQSFGAYLAAKPGEWQQALPILTILLKVSSEQGSTLPDDLETAAGQIAAPIRAMLRTLGSDVPEEAAVHDFCNLLDRQRRLLAVRLADPHAPVGPS